MNWQLLRNVKPNTGKIILLHVKDCCYFARLLRCKDGQEIMVVSYTFKPLLDIKNEMLPCFTLEQLYHWKAYWSLYTRP